MSGRQYPYIWAAVPWSQAHELTRGKHDGLPLLSKGLADRSILATYRQLRSMGLRPGGQDPVAVLYLYSRKAGGRKVFASLYLIAKAKPVRPMTPAKWHALNKANLARRTCPECHRDVLYVIHPTAGMCFSCLETSTTSTAVAA